jgi:hypothetical protein
VDSISYERHDCVDDPSSPRFYTPSSNGSSVIAIKAKLNIDFFQLPCHYTFYLTNITALQITLKRVAYFTEVHFSAKF